MSPSTLIFSIEGMTCSACANRIERVLGKMPQLSQAKASVNYASETAQIELPENLAHQSQSLVDPIVSALHKAGYRAIWQTPNAPLMPPTPERGLSEMQSCLLAFACAFPLMLPMIAHPAQVLGFNIHMHSLMLPPLWQALLAGIVQFGLGARFYRRGFSAWHEGGANMDTLVAIGTTSAFALSIALWLGGITTSDFYFESSAGLIAFVLLGKALEARAKKNANAAIASLTRLKPAIAHRLIDDKGTEKEEDVPAQSLLIGQIIRVRAGESLPADGKIVRGFAEIDESLINGEAVPTLKHPGAKVFASTINTNGLLEIMVTQAQNDTLLARIIRQVISAQNSKARVQKLVDRISAVFVPCVLIFALLTWVGWLIFLRNQPLAQMMTTATINAVSVLVIACPCALGLATPTAIVVAMGKAVQFGILIRDTQSLESLQNINRLVFDKTGTLTYGKFTVQSSAMATGVDEDKAISLCASIEQGSTHPIARAMVAMASARGLPLLHPTDINNEPGLGIRGTIAGRVYRLGSLSWHSSMNATIPENLSDWGEKHQTMSQLWLSEDHRIIAAFALADSLRPEAVPTIRRLIAEGFKVSLLSGDRHSSVAAMRAHWADIAQEHLTAEGELMPSEKHQRIRNWQSQKEVVAMVGDGMNDAIALAGADIGIAMGEGSETAIHSADITLLSGKLNTLFTAIALSRATMACIRRNLFFAFVFNTVCLPIAAFGWVNPLLAGALMAMSSLSVVTSSLWLKRFSAI